MKKTVIIPGLLVAISLLPAFLSGAGDAQSLPPAYEAVPDFGRAPLYFIPNQGQRDARALFYARTSSYTLWLANDGLVFDTLIPGAAGARDVTRIEFRGSRPDPTVAALEATDYRVSYFEGADPAGWRSGIPTSGGVLYQNLYDGINLKVYGVERQVEYDWIVKPDGEPAAIRIAFRDVHETRIDAAGDLIVRTPFGTARHRAPRAYQVLDGHRVEVEASFRKIGPDEFGFKVGTYDPRRDLIIDPYVIAASTYLGGGQTETASGVAVDAEGAAYVAGYTLSGDFPTSSAEDKALIVNDVFVTKMSPDGRSLVYTVLLGVGPLYEGSRLPSIAVDAKGAAYVIGSTWSPTFPVKNAFQPKYGGGYIDGFITKISPDGRTLAYSSYLGGSSGDVCSGVAADGTGAAYVLASSYSKNLRARSSFQAKNAGGLDAYVAKVAPSGQTLAYATYLGGTAIDDGMGIAIDASGAAYVVGQTNSNNFPVQSPYQKVRRGGLDIFLSKLAPDGKSLLYSTYWGGPSDDQAFDVAVDAAGNAYFNGTTDGSIVMKNAFQPTRKGSFDVILAKFAPNGKSIVFSTYVGGSRYDWARGLAVDAKGAVYLSGMTYSFDFPRKNATQQGMKGRDDAYVVKLAPDGKRLDFSTFLGGAYEDMSYDLALSPDGDIVVVGRTDSPDFPSVMPYQEDYAGGNNDCYVTRYAISKTAAPKRR